MNNAKIDENFVEVNANGSFMTPQMVSFAATQWNEKHRDDGVAYLACSEDQLERMKSMFENAERDDVHINADQQVISGVPIRVDRFVPKREMQLRAADHRIVVRIVALDR